MTININELRPITSPELYNPKTRKANPNGLFSEQIFGPEISFKCQCGKYSIRELHRDLRCPQCGVVCQSNDSRYTTFAKIVLSFPIILPIKSKSLERICNKKYKNLLDPLQSDYNISVVRYLKHNIDNDSFSITEKFDKNCVPINITGIYSLYIALSYIDGLDISTNSSLLLKSFSHNVLVTPPQTRYAYINRGKTINAPEKIISQQINNFYITLVQSSKIAWNEFPDPDNRLSYYIDQINNCRKIKTILTDDDLIMYDGLVSKYQYFVNNIYSEVLKLLSGKDGYVRKDFLGRSVDFSSRAVIVPNPNLKAYQIRIPRIAFIKLFFIEYLRYCLIVGKRSNSQVIRYVRDTQFNTKDFEDDDYDEFINWFFDESNVEQIDRLVLINRQPTLILWGPHIAIYE
jgi:DNA-directed RNA polymerase beta' subunit